MGRGAEVHFIAVLGFFRFDYRIIDQGFGDVGCDQSCPDLLFDIFRFACVEITQSDGIF
jgi:hypothetical protein